MGQLQLHFDAQSKRPFKLPTVTGKFKSDRAATSYPLWGTRASLVKVDADLLPHQKLRLKGEGLWGKEPFHFTGEGNIHHRKPELTIHLTGQQLVLSDTPEYYVIGSPDLHLHLASGKANITGKCLIPKQIFEAIKAWIYKRLLLTW